MLNFTSIKKRLSFLKLKKVWIPIVLIVIGIGIYFGLNMYEIQYKCILETSNTFPFVNCSSEHGYGDCSLQGEEGSFYVPCDSLIPGVAY